MLFGDVALRFTHHSGTLWNMRGLLVAGPAHAELAIAEVVRQMAHSKMNPADLARAAAVSPDTVNSFLSGERWPRDKTLSKVSSALGLSPEHLTVLGHTGSAIDQAPPGRLPAGSEPGELEEGVQRLFLVHQSLRARGELTLAADLLRAIQLATDVGVRLNAAPQSPAEPAD